MRLVLVVLCMVVATCHGQMYDLPMYNDMGMYRACLRECYRCVKIFGKRVYNGKRCADNCVLSNGRSLDTNCDRPSRRMSSRTSPTARCSYMCAVKCGPDFNHYGVDSSHDCVFTCMLSTEQIVTC